jgi:L-ascorbate metabolism protein UlaG (beta-lactamase superfamily)
MRKRKSFHNIEEDRRSPSTITLALYFLMKRFLSLGNPHKSLASDPTLEKASRSLCASEPSVTWIGHSTFLLQIAGCSIITDPVLGKRVGNRLVSVSRLSPPGLSFEQLPKIDIVLISHNHHDHLDNATIRRLGVEPTYLVPLGLDSYLQRLGCQKVYEYDWWQSKEIRGFRFSFVPAQHASYRGLWDKNRTLWGGWIIQGDSMRIYFAGDTAYFRGFRSIGSRYAPIDIALLPIGGYKPQRLMRAFHMTPEEAGQAYADLAAKVLIPMHWRTFPLTAEKSDEPLNRLISWWRSSQFDPESLWHLTVGETRRLGSPSKIDNETNRTTS